MKIPKIRITIEMSDDGSMVVTPQELGPVSPGASNMLMLGMLDVARATILNSFTHSRTPPEES